MNKIYVTHARHYEQDIGMTYFVLRKSTQNMVYYLIINMHTVYIDYIVIYWASVWRKRVTRARRIYLHTNYANEYVVVRCSCDVFGHYATLTDNGVSPNRFKAGGFHVDSLRRELAAVYYVSVASVRGGRISG